MEQDTREPLVNQCISSPYLTHLLLSYMSGDYHNDNDGDDYDSDDYDFDGGDGDSKKEAIGKVWLKAVQKRL